MGRLQLQRKVPARVRKLLVSACGTTLLVVVGASAIQFALWVDRPMFHNIFARNDRTIFARWVCQPPITDAGGNAVIADYERNLLVVFCTSSAHIDPSRFWHPKIVPHGVAFPDPNARDDGQFFLPDQSDRFIVFFPDGSSKVQWLGPNDAERIHRSLRPEASDLFCRVKALYQESRDMGVNRGCCLGIRR